MVLLIITVFSTRTRDGCRERVGTGCETPVTAIYSFFDYQIKKKVAGFQTFTVNAPAFVPAWVSPLVTLTFHRPVAAPAGIFTVQVILF
jgi:hypothetical protein